MDLRQALGEIAVALVGDDDRGAGLGDQEVGAGDADVGVEIALAQDLARLGHQVRRLVQGAVRRQMSVMLQKILAHLFLGHMHRRRDDMARRLTAKLDDVFAEVGLDHLDAGLFQVSVERHLLGDHGFALGDAPRPGLTANVENDPPRVLRRGRPVHLTTGLGDLLLVALQIEIEVFQGMDLDVARLIAQRLELRQPVGGLAALVDEAAAHVPHCLLQLRILERPGGVVAKAVGARVHQEAPS